MARSVLRLHPDDNVVVALRPLAAGTRLSGDGLVAATDVPAKHLVALDALAPGDAVRMYGGLIGRTTAAVGRGERLTTHNLGHDASGFTIRDVIRPDWPPPDVSRWRDRRFRGYRRADGRVGTANVWIVVPLVFCENRNVEMLRDALLEPLGYAPPPRYRALTHRLVAAHDAGADPAALLEITAAPVEAEAARRVFPHVDGVKFLLHQGGCGCTREDSDTLCALLAAYIAHPNVAGATVLSLGCQNAQVRLLEDALHRLAPDGLGKPVYVFEQQALGSEETLVSDALRHTVAGLAEADRARREPAGLEHLVFGMECGGSDAFSGISANPAIGHAADLLVAMGGSVVLSEFPELCGVEQQLIDRCVDRATAERFASIQRAYAARAEAAGSGFDMNPSPGNIRDGLLTDAMKSAGAARKGGTSPVAAVLDYPEVVEHPGLNLLCTPGNDVESTTGLAASGANVILFSTGLGTPTGNPITPVVKVSTNTPLAERMADIIDIDAGPVITGEATVEQIGERLFDYAIDVASGDAVPAAVRLGQDDFIPWKRAISL